MSNLSSNSHSCLALKACFINLFLGVSDSYYILSDISLATGLEIHDNETYMVNVNGDIIGLTRTPRRFVTSFRKLRRAGCINEFVSVYINQHHKIVYVACDAGRICRPMIVVEHTRPRVTDEHIKVLTNSFRDTAEAN